MTMEFTDDPPDRMLFRPAVLTSLNPAYGHLSNDGVLTFTATNGTATYRHTDAQDDCLVFERVNWEPVLPFGGVG